MGKFAYDRMWNPGSLLIESIISSLYYLNFDDYGWQIKKISVSEKLGYYIG